MKMTIAFLTFAIVANVYAGPYDFKSMDQDGLKKICGEICGAEYSAKAEIRDFYQLKIYPDAINQAGLLCSRPVEWLSKGTPCHTKKFHDGIHMEGLAPTKTELHRGNWATNQGGAWCIAYNEADFKPMSKAIKKGLFKPGQVACMSGVKLGTF